MDQQEKITPIHLLAQKRTGRKITMLSIYDCATARLADRAGLDTILVGDSLATSILALQLPFRFEVGSLSDGLMSSAPK